MAGRNDDGGKAGCGFMVAFVLIALLLFYACLSDLRLDDLERMHGLKTSGLVEERDVETLPHPRLQISGEESP